MIARVGVPGHNGIGPVRNRVLARSTFGALAAVHARGRVSQPAQICPGPTSPSYGGRGEQCDNDSGEEDEHPQRNAEVQEPTFAEPAFAAASAE